MEWDEINFNHKQVLNNLSCFYHFGICYDSEYDKREIIECALNKTHRKLIEALREGGTHVHKRNMIFTFQRLIELYQLAFIHDDDYYNKCLAEICLTRFEKNKDLIEQISKIINHESFSHRDHNILLRPYLFDFENLCFISWGHHYKQLRKSLEKELNKLVIKWISEEKELESMINEKVLEIIKEEVEE